MLRACKQTLTNPVVFEGIGLHSGKRSKITILPEQEANGIVFKRIDLHKNNTIVADYKNVSSTTLSTTLMNQHGVKVSTVEHLLAALFIAGVDCAKIEIDSEEVPIMDGSAKEFLSVLRKVKLKKLNEQIKYIKVLEKIELIDGERKIEISPKDTFEVDFELKFENKIIGNQRNNINFQSENLSEVEESRTFCLYEDIQKIKKMGLAKGGNLDNAIVVDKDKIINDDGLRNKKEFVNHKILDLAGDFFLSNYRILGSVYCFQGGHQFSNLFLHKLLKQKNKYKIFVLDSNLEKNRIYFKSNLKLAANA
jgi:UDP-3-O-[3-hydroxymyristoyl] N-acetylglucosamine deacetylase|tara:strand:+ start:17422 stop:18345 length:924 start_codon:yes stop_codon:yes gene_type:complete